MVVTAPPWRLRVEHDTVYVYPEPARASYNEVRLVPTDLPVQPLVTADLHVDPPTSLYRYRDYWGTEVVAFEVPGAHDHLQIRSTVVVDTRPAPAPPAGGWDEIAAASGRLAEYLAPTRRTAADDELAAVAARLRRPDPHDSTDAAVEWVRAALEYVPGETRVGTAALEAWRTGKAVCQDFAHLTLAVLRTMGIPARYVSGYVHPDPAARPGSEADGQSHAWVEAWTGDWWGIDPTNGLPAGERHVRVAAGRDYDDVPPVKGVYAGAAHAEMTVGVVIRRLR